MNSGKSKWLLKAIIVLCVVMQEGCVGLRYDKPEQTTAPVATGLLPKYQYDLSQENMNRTDLHSADYSKAPSKRFGEITTEEDLITSWGSPWKIEHQDNKDIYVYKKGYWALMGVKIYPVIPIPVPVIPLPRKLPDTRVEIESGKIISVETYKVSRNFWGCFLFPYFACLPIDLDHVEY